MKILKKLPVILALLMIAFSVNAQTAGAHTVQVAEFETLVNGGKGTILDVRTPNEFGEGHIGGAVNINYFDKDFQDQVSKLNKSKPVYVYCRTGGRSAKAMEIMKGAGFTTIYNLDGGFTAWSAAHK